tara:strand:- start:598 stop:1221 length:624 start_codon:yes stop_codon:yes gene_type:complete
MKFIKYILILSIIFLTFLIYRIVFDDKEILILTNNDPIREKPIDAPEMKDPEITPCVYSLWNENTPCQSTEDLLNEKKEKKGFYTIRYAIFESYKDAQQHIKKLRTLDEIKKLKLEIETVDQEKIIRVKKGDTLSRIAAIHGVSINELVILNSIKDPSKIKLNQKISIPLSDKYRIITINMDGYKETKRICNILVDNQFTCLIKSQE